MKLAFLRAQFALQKRQFHPTPGSGVPSGNLLTCLTLPGAMPPGFQTIQRNANLGCAFDITHFMTIEGSSENALEHFQFVR
jgi:hypothetical protein